jgi:DNA-binding transcriptional ArsR family regulator
MLTRCRSRRRPTNTRSPTKLIDRIRHNIQERLDQLLAEVEKLGHALAALDPRERKPASRAERSRSTPLSKSAPPKASAKARPAKPAPVRATTQAASSARTAARTAPGATKAKVLSALSKDGALTAGDVAKATGLARPTVSTTLSKLAKSGEVVKAERGYRLPGQEEATAAVRVSSEGTTS